MPGRDASLILLKGSAVRDAYFGRVT